MISADAIRGYIDIMLLSLLQNAPSYPYELAHQISRVAGDTYSIKQTTLYSAVKRLEAAEQVTSFAGTSSSGKPRTYYRITPNGIAHLHLKTQEWHATKTVVDRFIQSAEGRTS